jgi:arylsulfatase A-like enzyme
LKTGVLQGYSRALIEAGRPTIASLLKENGYATAAIGKWHLGFQAFDPRREERDQPVDYSRPLRPGPVTVGFDEFFGIPASLDMPPYVFVENDRPTEMPSAKVAESGDAKYARGPFWRAGAAAPSFRHADVLPRLTERAVAFLDRQAKSPLKQPFFLYLALSGPHTPYLPSAQFRGHSGAGDYGDFVETIDASVGEVLKALDRNGLADNTFLAFASDNGARWTPEEISQFGHRSNLNNRGQKSDIYDGGHRIPFIVRWPGHVRAGSTSEELGCLVDLMATCAGVADVRLPRDSGRVRLPRDSGRVRLPHDSGRVRLPHDAGRVRLPHDAAEDSFDLRSALLGEAHRPIRDAVVHHSGSGLFAIRSGDWKLVLGLGSGGFTRPAKIEAQSGQPREQLYNLKTDREEQTNVAAEHPEVVRSLREKLEQIQRAGRSHPDDRPTESPLVVP